MKRIINLTLLGLLVATIAPHTSSFANQTPEEELKYLEYKLADAIVIRDISFLGYIYADGFVQTDPYIGRISKGQLLARVISNADRVTSVKISNLDMRVYGTTAIVTGRAIVNGQIKQSQSAPYYEQVALFTHTYVKRKGKWKMIAAHWSTMNSDK